MHLENLNSREELLVELFQQWADETAITINILPKSGSSREYFRIKSENKSAIGVYNQDQRENEAFIEFSKDFKKKGLKVPEIYADKKEYGIYLQEDLGGETIYQRIEKIRNEENYQEQLYSLIKTAVDDLVDFQYKADKNLDYSLSYPREAFDRQSMNWDLSYFKYYFLKLADIEFDEQHLENDFNDLIDILLKSGPKLFLFRDFQTRNIMIKDDELFYIDYQGGRKGSIHYDLASILFDSKADIPQSMRDKLVNDYCDKANEVFDIDREKFNREFYFFVLIRIMQAMGAYGFRGFYEGKTHFLKSIPFAVNNLNWILKNINFEGNIQYLLSTLKKITTSKKLLDIANQDVLKVSINSFSYKKGIPQDTSGNGGGFVFDCRWIHNPGRYQEYKTLNGRDQAVIDFLDKEPDMHIHLQSVFSLVDRSVKRFIDRGFTHLMVNFGCTGGQHRSVYSAEKLAKYLKKNFNIRVDVHHIEQNIRIENYKE
jgi:aminoglycoside/choline kinase family phosphotransferase